MENNQPVVPAPPATPVPAAPPAGGGAAAATAAAREAAAAARAEAYRVLIRSVHIDDRRIITCQQRSVSVFQSSGHHSPVFGSVLPYAHRVRQFGLVDFSAYYNPYMGIISPEHHFVESMF
jgi:hypothetical protein